MMINRDYVIYKMAKEGLSYNEALREAHSLNIKFIRKEKYLILKKLLHNKELTEKQQRKYKKYKNELEKIIEKGREWEGEELEEEWEEEEEKKEKGKNGYLVKLYIRCDKYKHSRLKEFYYNIIIEFEVFKKDLEKLKNKIKEFLMEFKEEVEGIYPVGFDAGLEIEGEVEIERECIKKIYIDANRNSVKRDLEVIINNILYKLQ